MEISHFKESTGLMLTTETSNAEKLLSGGYPLIRIDHWALTYWSGWVSLLVFKLHENMSYKCLVSGMDNLAIPTFQSLLRMAKVSKCHK